MSENFRNICQEMISDVYSVYECIGTVYTCMKGSSWQWSYGSWFYNYLCNQYLSPHRCRDWYGSLGLTPVPIWKMPCMIWKISCHNIFITHILHWLFFKHCLLYCRKDLWTDKLRKKILKRVACVRVWFQKDIKQCRSVQWR